MVNEMKSRTVNRFTRERIFLLIVIVISMNVVSAQTYDMKIIKGTVSVFAQTNTIDSITFSNTNSFVCGDVILHGGESYPTVLVGSQCWFQKNLNIGTRIADNLEQTDNSIIEKYCYNNLEASCTTFGGLYQWAEALQYKDGTTNLASQFPPFTANVQGLCPIDWHIPTKPDFITLQATVSGNGNALKFAAWGSTGVNDSIGVGINTSGFSALLTGYRFYGGGNYDLNHIAHFWAATPGSGFTDEMYLRSEDSAMIFASFSSGKEIGYSIRCVKN